MTEIEEVPSEDTTPAGEPGAVDGGPPPEAPAESSTPGVLRVAAIASLAAGAIHATAAGAHSEHRSAVVAFAVTAVLQIGWGALAFSRSGRAVALAGAAINAAAFGGWVMAKTTGIDLVTGLEAKESPQFADSLAAGFAVVAVVGAIAALVPRLSFATRPHPALVGVAGLAALALVVPGMVQTGGHSHAGGHAETAGGHAHGETAGAHDDHAAAATTPAKPYDATLPVDLGGVPGVTPEQQAEAEEMVTISLEKLPQFADIPTIEAMGYRSIGDAGTGNEHFMKWDLIADGRVLDPDYPESLVFDVDRETGEKTLAAAMFMANPDDTLDTVPDLGGDLVQWHIHDNLCYAGEPGAWRVADVAAPDEECRPGTQRLSDNPVPMVHVWIRPHPCGPFAALEGVGAGQISAGEERLCDHAHGA
ncbi:MAG TPA: hypothetical protein VJM49_03645 [Acidimicrobiales bacterium]|nr:hypothetical protein [Acidimicrobiales bacterium]